MAIQDIFIFDNSSVVPDESLAQRIGFIPVKTDLESYDLPEVCDCGSELGCAKCRVVLTLDVEAKNGNKTVYSRDFISEDPKVVAVSPDILIAKLAPDQAIRLEAYAQLGFGKDHAKWQPVSQAIYQHVGEVEIDENKCTACGKCAEVCPRSVLSLKDEKLRVVDIYECTLCGECVKACPVAPSAISQDMKVDAFIFTVESTGCLPPERIVAEAANRLIIKFDEFSGKIKRGETSDEITAFEIEEQEGRRLYSVGAGDFEDEEEEEEQ